MSDESEDLREFMDTAIKTGLSGMAIKQDNSQVDGNPIPIHSGRAQLAAPQEPGQPTQWACNGPGYIPVTPTVKALPAGIYKICIQNDMWTLLPQNVNTDDLILLPDTKSSEVIGEINKFWLLAEKFKAFGFTHKRGFLLWGPQGSGKTSTLQFVMKQLVRDGGIVILAPTQPHVLADMLGGIRRVEPERPIIVVLEDIDAYIAQSDESKVLSLLDGESSIDHVIFIATTNYPEKLDGRVINRPSRFDRVVKIDVPNADARRVYLSSRKLPLLASEIESWVANTDRFSIAHLKEVIVSVFGYGASFEDTVKRLRNMAKPPRSDNSDARAGFGAL